MGTNMKKYFLPVMVAALTILSFQNCSDVSFQTSNNGKLDGGPTGDQIETVNRLCNNAGASLKTMTFNITFKNPSAEATKLPVCQWDTDGNISRHDQYVTARYEQRMPVTLPANSNICGATFNFPTQEIQYDDQFFFIFNNKIVASNASFVIDNGRIQKANYNLGGGKIVSVPDYNWANMVDTKWPAGFNDTDAYNFCLGKNENLGVCNWPITERNGDINMAFDPSLMRAVGLDGKDSTHEIGFIMTGDNDDSTDCQHKPLSFSVTVQYIQN
jgi:hypothetical protein